jgi:hypothetical protein
MHSSALKPQELEESVRKMGLTGKNIQVFKKRRQGKEQDNSKKLSTSGSFKH